MTLKFLNSILHGAKRDCKTQQLHRILEENLISSSCGNKKALIFNNRELTYNDLNNAANRMAALLLDQIHACKSQPNRDGDWIIAICMPPSDDFIITLLAILKTGAAYLPMDAKFPQNRIDHILQEAQPAMVIYDSKTIQRNSFGNTAAVISFDECKSLVSKYECTNITDDRTLRPTNTSCDLALVLYTSGSTGIPKGVRLPHSAIMNRLQWQWETFPFSSTEKICAFKTAITFVDSLSEIWGPLLAKKTVLVVPKCTTKDPSQLVALLQKYKIERLVVVPTLLKSILFYLSLQNDECLLSNLKLWICSGETLPVSLANEFFDYFRGNEYMLCNFYGSTEIMGDVTYFVCRGKEQLQDYTFNIPIGSPMFNTTIYILDSDRKPVAFGETGEIFVSGQNLAHGYVNGRDKDRFIDNFMAIDLDHAYLYQTGDYASVHEDGVIHYEGRTDSQIKIRGHRVDLSEIQKHLLEIDGVDKAIVLCNKDEFGKTILAFVSTTDAILSPAPKSKKIIVIEDILRSKLADYMVPQIIMVDEMPLLVNGKIDRQSLLMMFSDSNNNESAIDFDFNGVSQSERQKAGALFETITEVIGRTLSSCVNISLESNFYALGGNSLNSIYTIAKLRDRGYSIEIADFISATSLAEIVNSMEEIKENVPQIDTCDKNHDFTIEPLKMEHKNEAIHILACSFAEKNIIHRYMTLKIPYSAFVEDQNIAWDGYVSGGHSFVIKDRDNNIVGVALNNDTDNKLKGRPPTSIFADFSAYHGYLKTQIIDKLPTDKRILESCFVATHECLNSQENVMAVTFMESETVRLAKEHGFHAIISNNSHPLTQQLARFVFKYETLFDYQINKFVIEGRRPFDGVPDDVHALIQWKTV